MMLAAGATYVATVTGTRDGVRVYRDLRFTAARNQDPEPFIRDRAGSPDQDRVFTTPLYGGGGQPTLVVTGSIRRVTENLVHLMGDDLLDACGEAAPGHLTVTPVAADVTCSACLEYVHA